MKPTISQKIKYALLLLSGLIISGCNPHSTAKCGPCPLMAYMLPYMNFRVVDKTTSQDLFFGTQARFKPSQLKMFHIVNGKADSAAVRRDTVNHFFNVFITPAHSVDTVTMQVPGLTQDILLFKTENTAGCCSRLVLDAVTFNGQTVYPFAIGVNVAVFYK
ncbi:MAG: hypothetical protein NVSMB24_29440 [Mucilaginibacter sp.]